MNRLLHLSSLLCLCCAFARQGANAALVIYPEYPAQIERDYAYRVTVVQRGGESREIPVYNHCEKSPLAERTYGGDVNRRFCEFAFDGGPARIDIAVCEDVGSYAVFPSRLGLSHRFHDGVISVILDRPCNFGIRLNDSDKSILSVFADAPEDPAKIPAKGDPGVLFVEDWLDPPGETGILEIEPPVREVYIAPGAVLNARLVVKTPGAFVHGRGMVLDPLSDVFRFDQTKNTRRLMVNVAGTAKGATVEDVKLIDARTFNFGSWADGVTFRNVKALSSMMCSDGITCGGANLLVDGAWLYVGDNGLVISDLRDSTFRNVAIGTSCNAIFPQHGNERITLENIDVFRADEGLIKNTYNGALRRDVKWDELTAGGAKRQRGPQDLQPQPQSFFIRNLSADDCVLFSRFFVGGNMGTLPKTFAFENLRIPHCTGEAHWRSIGKTNGTAITIYDDPAKWLVTDNYTLAITNLWIGGRPASGFPPATVKNGHLVKVEVSPGRAAPAARRQNGRFVETPLPEEAGGDASTMRPPWCCPYKTYIGDALVRDWRLNFGAPSELRLPAPPSTENHLADRGSTRSDWQRSPAWLAKVDAVQTAASSSGPAAASRIYRVRQCERNAGIANVITEKFLQHGPGCYRLAFDAAARLENPAQDVPLEAAFISNRTNFIASFTLPGDASWQHCETVIDLPFDPAVTDLVALRVRAKIPTDELLFKDFSLQEVAGCPDFSVAPPRVRGGAVRAADFGFSTSNGVFICRSGGWFKMTDSEISLHNDDSLNFHDSTTIARAEGLRTVRVVNNGGTASLAAEPGMEIELRQEDYAVTGWTGRIVSIDDRTIAFDRDLPPQSL